MTPQEELYQQVQEAFKDCVDVGSGELLRFATEYAMGGSVDITVAIIGHSADLHTNEDPFNFEERTWTELFVEACRRTFYDEQGSAKYGTHHIYSNPGMLKLVTLELIKYANTIKFDDTPFEPVDLPANVLQFPAPTKTRQ